MESESDEVVEIKKDEVECNHRIVELYCHRNCEKSAEICEQRCKINLAHDYSKFDHKKATINEFKTAFTNLESIATK